MIYPGSTPVGNATLVVANVLTCNKYSQKKIMRHGMGNIMLLRQIPLIINGTHWLACNT